MAAIAGTQFGDVNAFSRIIYILVALSGIYQIFTLGAPRTVPERRIP